MKKFIVQSLVLLGGTIFAWVTVFGDFERFYQVEGTLFKVKDCVVPNPVTTACFYGAIAFLLALTWSIVIIKFINLPALFQRQKYLFWFLIAGTIFAWYNVTKLLITFYSTAPGPKIGCSGQALVNPYTTPCFIGASIFLLALIVSGVILYRLRKRTSN